MIYQNLSRRQKLAMLWWAMPRFSGCDALICDGAVRSGKTLSMAVGFMLWSMQSFDGQIFGICGKTIESLRRNVILHLSDWLGGVLTIREARAENKLIVTDSSGRCNIYYLFGGRDESSYSLIQGITLAGVLFDEVALMPRSFVDQALARCSVSGSKFWFNCNPGGPEHWFHSEWIQKKKERNALHLRFTMQDNLSLDQKIKARYERMYSGVFYRRYILGEWCLAEGRVYEFDEDRHVVDTVPDSGAYYISCDYGTQNPFSAGLWCVSDGKAVRVREYYYNGRAKGHQLTDEAYHTALLRLAEGVTVSCVVVDPSASSFIACIVSHGRFAVRKAKNSVLNGIRAVSGYLDSGRLLIHRDCKDCIREFSAYVWDEKSKEDRPIEQNDHAMDDVRYFCSTIMPYAMSGKALPAPPELVGGVSGFTVQEKDRPATFGKGDAIHVV